VRQEQAAGPERVAHGEGERDLPDGAVELAVADEMGPPVRLDEAVWVIGCERAAAAGIQRAQALDGPEQGLAAGGGLERQGEKRRQVLAQRAVAREHGVEMAARFQPLVGPAGDCRLDRRRRVLRVAERSHALRAVGRHQRIDGAEHAVQPVARTAAQAFAPFLDRRARPSVHAGQEQVVHLDDLVEQRLAGLDEVAGDERVALRLGKAPEVAGIVAAPELAELADDPRVEVAEVRAGAEQVLDQAQADDVALDHRGVGRPRVVLEPEQAGPRVALRHFDQQVDGFAQEWRQADRDCLVQLGRGLRHLGRDQPFERAGGRQHDVPVAQLVLGAHHELGDGAALDGALTQPVPQVHGGSAVEAAQAEVATDAQRLGPLRLRPARPVEEQHGRQPELAREVVDDLDRGVPVVVEEAAVETHDAELQGEATAMIRPAALGDHGQVRGHQAPVPRQVVLARIRRQHPSPDLRRSQGVIRRH